MKYVVLRVEPRDGLTRARQHQAKAFSIKYVVEASRMPREAPGTIHRKASGTPREASGTIRRKASGTPREASGTSRNNQKKFQIKYVVARVGQHHD